MVTVGGYAMPASPLCVAVPLEGSDSVVGLSLLGRQNSSDFGLWRTLTFENLSEAPKNWKDFFAGRNGTNMAYGYPCQPESVQQRLESNLNKFMVMG